jgi:hypothetical protein
MCDLKKTLDAGVRYPWCTPEVAAADVVDCDSGSLRVGNAIRNRKDCVTAQSYRLVSTGESMIADCCHSSLVFNNRLLAQFYPRARKLIYCSRTVPEIEKALAELKRLMEYRESEGAKDEGFRGFGLTSRKNLCLHPEVSSTWAIHRRDAVLTAIRGRVTGQQGEEGKDC